MGSVTQYTKQSYVISVAFDEDDAEEEKVIKSEQTDGSISPTRKPRLKSKKNIRSNLQSHEIEVDRNNLKWSKDISD